MTRIAPVFTLVAYETNFSKSPPAKKVEGAPISFIQHSPCGEQNKWNSSPPISFFRGVGDVSKGLGPQECLGVPFGFPSQPSGTFA